MVGTLLSGSSSILDWNHLFVSFPQTQPSRLHFLQSRSLQHKHTWGATILGHRSRLFQMQSPTLGDIFLSIGGVFVRLKHTGQVGMISYP